MRWAGSQYRATFAVAATLFRLTAGQASSSCYVTSTVLPISDLSMFTYSSMLPPPPVSNPTSSLTTTSAALSTSSSSATSTTPSSLAQMFYITVNVPSSRVVKRATEYIAFEGVDAIVVDIEEAAALFYLTVDGQLKSGEDYVGTDGTSGTSALVLFSTPPTEPYHWTANSTTLTFGNATFCLAADDQFFVVFDNEAASGCQAVSVAPLVNSANTTSSMIYATTSDAASTTLLPVLMTTSTTKPSTTVLSSLGNIEASGSLSLLSQSTSSPLLSGLTSSTTLATSLAPSSPLLSVEAPTSLSSSAALGQSTASLSPLTSLTSSNVGSGTGQLTSSANSAPSSTSSSSLRHSTSTSSSSSTQLVSINSGTTLSQSSSPLTASLTTSTASSSSSARTCSATPESAPTVPNKILTGRRGMAYTAANTTGLYPPPTELSWAYNYYSLPNASNNVGTYPYTSGYPLRFIPLLFNDQSSLTSVWSDNVNYSIANYGTDAVFSFNEPDACFGGLSSCMTVVQAIPAYSTYIQPFAGRVQLGAPAVTNAGSGLTWLQQFLGNATQNCLTVDFVNIHWYASPYNMQYFIDYMNNASIIAQGRPIWITEYGMDDNGGMGPYAETAVQAFLKNTTYYCDQQPSTFIYRYAWFGNYQNNLLNSGATALSPRGLLWDNYTGGYVYSFNKRGESTGLRTRAEEEKASSWLDVSPEEVDDPMRGKWNWKDAGGHIDPDWISFVRGERVA